MTTEIRKKKKKIKPKKVMMTIRKRQKDDDSGVVKKLKKQKINKWFGAGKLTPFRNNSINLINRIIIKRLRNYFEAYVLYVYLFITSFYSTL